MTLREYFLKHRQRGLVELAQKTGSRLNYIQQLMYNPKKRPSLEFANKLVEASGGEITIEGLSNPTEFNGRTDRA